MRARGVEVRDGVRVDAVKDHGAGAQVETSAGSVRARVVVGCDGVGSVVRRTLGIGTGRLRAQVVEVDTEPVRGDPPRSLLHFDASDRRLPGYAWDFPTQVDGQALVCRGVYRLRVGGDSADDGSDVSAPARRLTACAGNRPVALQEQALRRARCSSLPSAWRGLVMLRGEAAGIDPVTGEGIAQAIEYGVLAGSILARSLATDSRCISSTGGRDEVAASRLAWDLRIRTRFVRMFYGPSRPEEVERFLTESSDALHLRMAASTSLRSRTTRRRS